MNALIDSFLGEWLKRRRSAATTLVWAGAFFIPAIALIGRLDSLSTLATANAAPHVWEALYGRCWQFMGFFLLPMGVILATSLVTQLEFKNNTWKQVHTSPQPLTRVFWAKLAVIGTMLLQFFFLFNTGIYLVGVIPGLFISGVHYPAEPFPLLAFLKGNGYFFIDCLPIVALQYLVSLQFRNFLVPLGLGIALYVAGMMATLWKYGYIVPYAYCALNFTRKGVGAGKTANIHGWALAYFGLFTIVAYILYITKKDKS